VELVSLKETSIVEVTETGIKMDNGKEHDIDVLILATGFDAVTGGLTQMDIRDKTGVSLKERWSQGVYSYLGVAVSGFPNLFYMYGPQGPASFCNLTCSETQADFIVGAIDYMEQNKLDKIEANGDAEIEYKKLINMITNSSLFPLTDRLVIVLYLQGNVLPNRFAAGT
jgi:cation diffusion facilitator CzcD-associated flavoprotein CzcO